MEASRDLDLQFFLYIGLFIGCVLMFEAVRQTLGASLTADRQKSRRLRMLARGMGKEDLLAKYRHTRPGPLHRIPFFGNIPQKMRQAGMTLKPSLLIMTCTLAAAAVYLSALSLTGPLPAFAMAFVLSIVLPMAIINIARKRRIEKFSQQLPDALDLMKRGLSVGHPLNVTISNVARTMPDPIGTEFGLLADQITYGDSLSDAMMDLADRIDHEDFYYLAVSIDIQHGTGGNLAAMLGTLSNVIRRRFAMRRRVRAISSEGRISAIILSCLPVVMYLGTTFMSPDYYSSVSDAPAFIPIVVAIFVLVTANALWLRKLVTFRI